MDAVKSFNMGLSSLHEEKLEKSTTSKAKLAALTRDALKAIKFNKHVVQSVETFILKCKPEYKISGLCMIDSIVQQSRHQFGSDKDVFAYCFSKNIQQTFINLFKCPAEDKSKIISVLNLWQKNQVFPPEVIQPLFDLADPNNNIFKELENNNSGTASATKALMATTENQQGNDGLHGTSTNLNFADPNVLQLEQLQGLITKNVESSSRCEQQVHLDNKPLEIDCDNEDDAFHPSPGPQQPTAEAMLPITNLLTNPEVLRHLQTFQQIMANVAQLPIKEIDMDKMRKLQEMKQQEDEFDKRLAQIVPNLPFAVKLDLRSEPNPMAGNNDFLKVINPLAHYLSFEAPVMQTIDKRHSQDCNADAEVINLDSDDSKSQSADDKYKKRRTRIRSRSRFRDVDVINSDHDGSRSESSDDRYKKRRRRCRDVEIINLDHDCSRSHTLRRCISRFRGVDSIDSNLDDSRSQPPDDRYKKRRCRSRFNSIEVINLDHDDSRSPSQDDRCKKGRGDRSRFRDAEVVNLNDDSRSQPPDDRYKKRRTCRSRFRNAEIINLDPDDSRSHSSDDKYEKGRRHRSRNGEVTNLDHDDSRSQPPDDRYKKRRRCKSRDVEIINLDHDDSRSQSLDDSTKQRRMRCNSKPKNIEVIKLDHDDSRLKSPDDKKERRGRSRDVEIINLKLDDSRSPTPDDRYKKRNRSKSRSRGRSGRNSRKSKSRSGSRSRNRSRPRDRNDRSKDKEKTKEEKEKESERERERKKRGLPPIKKDCLSICSTTLWVGHLSNFVNQEVLSNTFGVIGDVVSIDLVPPRGCAFIVMLRRQDAAKCLTKLKGHYLHGKSITLAWAQSKGVKGKDLKDYWEGDLGVSYVPYAKLKRDVDIDMIEDGGMIDEETMPDWMKEIVDKIGAKKTSREAVPTFMSPTLGAGILLQPPTIMPWLNPFQFNSMLLGMNVLLGMMPNMTGVSNIPNNTIEEPPLNMGRSSFQGPPNMVPTQMPSVDNECTSASAYADWHNMGQSIMHFTQSLMIMNYAKFFGIVPRSPAAHEETFGRNLEEDWRDRIDRYRDAIIPVRDRDNERSRERRDRHDRRHNSSDMCGWDRRDDRRDTTRYNIDARDINNWWADRDRDSSGGDRRDRDKILNYRFRELAGMEGAFDERGNGGRERFRDMDGRFEEWPPLRWHQIRGARRSQWGGYPSLSDQQGYFINGPPTMKGDGPPMNSHKKGDGDLPPGVDMPPFEGGEDIPLSESRYALPYGEGYNMAAPEISHDGKSTPVIDENNHLGEHQACQVTEMERQPVDNYID